MGRLGPQPALGATADPPQRPHLGELVIVRGAVRPEQPSTGGGATYKRLLLRSLSHFDAALRWDSRGIRRYMRGRRGGARAAWEGAALHFTRSRRLERRAVRAIEG